MKLPPVWRFVMVIIIPGAECFRDVRGGRQRQVNYLRYLTVVS